ncbi:MAG TPA: DNA repair protein RecN [Actinomycetota bacterium]|nr:DNA repair protein RecN [Actinomycetota bacterium]
MLRELHIGGLGVIEDLDLELHEGLNVLTGETGAGKTMVTVGLSLALGARGASSLVRKGVTAARVQARFDAPPGFDEWAEDGEIVLARAIAADGKGSARISGQISTASALADVGGRLVELHGQHQAQRLLTTGTQTAFLDRFAGDRHLVALGTYRETFDRLRATRAALEELESAARERERELDLLAYQVREIETVAPLPGESDALAAEEARLGHVERLLEHAAVVEEALAAEGGLLDGLAAVSSSVEAAAALDAAAQELAERSRSGLAELGELARDVRAYRESLAVDPDRLREVRERVGALKGLQRKYGATDLDVLAFLTDASARLATLAGADERLAALARDVGELDARAVELASLVTVGRANAAPRLAGAIADEINELGMPEAAIEIALETRPGLTASGAERVEVRLAAGPDQDPMPLAKAASGGELSRTMLACRSVLADLDDVPTLVFDEVDAGIGGQAGLAVGKRLARLARGRQVVVVTHLPQIACFADRHVRVEKDRGTAMIQVLSEEDRIRELSRMLAGLPGTDRAVSHAEELLAEAGKARATG